jgi:hypothetical protein
MAKRSLIAEGRFEEIQKLARKASEVAKSKM